MIVTICNWEKYNGRKDIKRPWWFKLSNTLLEDSQFYNMNGEEIRAWIYLLSQASKHQTGSIHLDEVHARQSCNINIAELKSLLKKLKQFQIIDEDPYAIRTRSVQQIRLEEKREEEIRSDAHPYAEWADVIYSLYPRKVGKKAGWVKMKRILKTEKDFEKLKTSVINYTRFCEKREAELKYIKQFDTFLTTWEDWLDPEAGTGIDFKKQVQYLTEEELNEGS